MNDHDKQDHKEEHGDLFKLYFIVFGALAVLTGVSFGAYKLFGQGPTSLLIIMAVSVVKATLVAVIFMHLKYDWGKVFGIMIPVVIMAIIVIIVLLPDVVFAWHHKENIVGPEAAAAETNGPSD